jgi:hypothetical protein
MDVEKICITNIVSIMTTMEMIMDEIIQIMKLISENLN